MKDHPFFPAKDSQSESPEVGYIRVTRRHDGKMKSAPIRYTPEELQDEATLFALYGGGSYELVAHDVERHQIQGRTAITLDGPSRPLSPPETAQPAAVAGAPVAPAATQPGGAANVLPWIGVLAPLALEYFKSQSALQQMQAAQQMQMMMAMMTSGSSRADSYVQSMQALHDRSLQELVAVMKANGGGGGGSSGDFKLGVEFVSEFLNGQNQQKASADNEGEWLETIKQVVEGAKMFMTKPAAEPVAP